MVFPLNTSLLTQQSLLGYNAPPSGSPSGGSGSPTPPPSGGSPFQPVFDFAKGVLRTAPGIAGISLLRFAQNAYDLPLPKYSQKAADLSTFALTERGLAAGLGYLASKKVPVPTTQPLPFISTLQALGCIQYISSAVDILLNGLGVTFGYNPLKAGTDSHAWATLGFSYLFLAYPKGLAAITSPGGKLLGSLSLVNIAGGVGRDLSEWGSTPEQRLYNFVLELVRKEEVLSDHQFFFGWMGEFNQLSKPNDSVKTLSGFLDGNLGEIARGFEDAGNAMLRTSTQAASAGKVAWDPRQAYVLQKKEELLQGSTGVANRVASTIVQAVAAYHDGKGQFDYSGSLSLVRKIYKFKALKEDINNLYSIMSIIKPFVPQARKLSYAFDADGFDEKNQDHIKAYFMDIINQEIKREEAFIDRLKKNDLPDETLRRFPALQTHYTDQLDKGIKEDQALQNTLKVAIKNHQSSIANLQHTARLINESKDQTS